MPIEIRRVDKDRMPDLLVPISTAFGLVVTPERIERARAVPELDTLFAAFDGEQMVGTAGAFTFGMTVPGGVAVETSGLTLVAVMPTHRRSGVLREMMRRQLDGAHARGQAVAALFASEGGIYGRFGYGMAALRADMELRKERAVLLDVEGPTANGRARFVGEEEAAGLFPQVWERVRLTRPGMLTRSEVWWRWRRLADPDGLRAGRPPLQRVVYEVDGEPVAYALYRFGAPVFASGAPLPIDVMECLGDSVASTRAIWRYLFSLDLVEIVRTSLVPVDHPLVLSVAEPSRLALRIFDGIWVRLVDVAAALGKRRFAVDAELVIEVRDAFCPWNTGRYRLEGGVATRTDAAADLALEVDGLGAAYLGGISFTQLAYAGRARELRPGGLARADATFRTGLLPWCPEIF